jgi:hypothetical protein
MMLEEDVLLSQWTRNAQECLSLKVGGRAMSSYRVDKDAFCMLEDAVGSYQFSSVVCD